MFKRNVRQEEEAKKRDGEVEQMEVCVMGGIVEFLCSQ